MAKFFSVTLRPRWAAFASATFFGILTHIPAMVLLLNNHDNLNNQPFGYGAGATSGRWMLQLTGGLFHRLKIGYNLPFFNALALILLLACSAVLLISVLNVRNSLNAGLIGALMTVVPAVASTLMYRFASIYYGIAILLSVLAPWLVKKSMRYIPLAALCIGCSLGIYQAYVPLTIAIFVLMLLRQALEGQSKLRELVINGISAAVCLVLGLAVYLVCMKVTLHFLGEALTDYQGINQMGSISLRAMPLLILETVKGCLLPIREYCGLSYYPLIRLTYGLLYLVSLLLFVYILRRLKDPFVMAFACIMVMALPVAINFIVIMCPDSYVYTLMVYSFFLLGCIPAILLECIAQTEDNKLPLIRKAVPVLMAFLIVGYIYQTNINYTAAYFVNRQTENYVSALVTQVRMTEDFDTDKKWVFLGEIQDPLLRSNWGNHISYGGIANTQALLNSYSLPNWLYNYCGYAVPMADEATVSQLWETEEVQAMACWPNAGSIKVINDTVVIKCQDQP